MVDDYLTVTRLLQVLDENPTMNFGRLPAECANGNLNVLYVSFHRLHYASATNYTCETSGPVAKNQADDDSPFHVLRFSMGRTSSELCLSVPQPATCAKVATVVRDGMKNIKLHPKAAVVSDNCGPQYILLPDCKSWFVWKDACPIVTVSVLPRNTWAETGLNPYRIFQVLEGQLNSLGLSAADGRRLICQHKEQLQAKVPWSTPDIREPVDAHFCFILGKWYASCFIDYSKPDLWSALRCLDTVYGTAASCFDQVDDGLVWLWKYPVAPTEMFPILHEPEHEWTRKQIAEVKLLLSQYNISTNTSPSSVQHSSSSCPATTLVQTVTLKQFLQALQRDYPPSTATDICVDTMFFFAVTSTRDLKSNPGWFAVDASDRYDSLAVTLNRYANNTVGDVVNALANKAVRNPEAVLCIAADLREARTSVVQLQSTLLATSPFLSVRPTQRLTGSLADLPFNPYRATTLDLVYDWNHSGVSYDTVVNIVKPRFLDSSFKAVYVAGKWFSLKQLMQALPCLREDDLKKLTAKCSTWTGPSQLYCMPQELTWQKLLEVFGPQRLDSLAKEVDERKALNKTTNV